MQKGSNMAKEIQVWEYGKNDPKLEMLINKLLENRKLIVIFDEDDDEDSYLLVGNAENEKRDLEQAQLFLELIETEKFRSK